MDGWRPESAPLRLLCAYARGAPRHRGKERLLRGFFALFYRKGGWLRSDGGVRFHADPQEYLGWMLLTTGVFEPLSLALATTLMREAPDSLFLDIGANQGLFSCTVGVGSRCPVISIEAAPAVFGALQRNARANESLRATLVHACAAPTATVVEFFVPLDRRLAAWAGPRPKVSATHGGLEGFWAGALALETILQDLTAPRVHVLKIDVEGFETDVFRGLDWEGRFRPRHILIECEPSEREKIDYLTSRGYLARRVDGASAEGSLEFPEGNLWFTDSRA